MDLSKYNNSNYYPGAGSLKRLIWYYINAFIFCSWLIPSSRIKIFLLKVFGAKLGVGIVIKPRVNIKYPWNLEIGNHVWIGEGCWVDSLAKVTIGSNVCISQDAYLLTGNHNYKDPAFELITQEIVIDDGVWVGAKSVVCPGSVMKKKSILAVGSVLSGNTEVSGIYQGNPAKLVRQRKMNS